MKKVYFFAGHIQHKVTGDLLAIICGYRVGDFTDDTLLKMNKLSEDVTIKFSKESEYSLGEIKFIFTALNSL